MFVTERFIADLIKDHGKYPISTDFGTWYPHQICKFLKINYHLHSSYEKSIIERTIQYIRDRTKECFDDYFLCKKRSAN
jgi:putative transposase